MPIIAFGIIFVLAVIIVAILRAGALATDAEQQEAAFERAKKQETSTIGRLMLGMGRTFSGSRYIALDPESSAYTALRLKLVASGGLYGSSPAVFLSVQIAAGLVSFIILGYAFLSGMEGLILIIMALVAGGIAYYPYQRIGEAAKKRSEAVDRDLPEFAELLLMPLSSGYGIIPALDFTATRMNGPVSDEVKVLLNALNAGIGSEADVFAAAGERLGTAAARAFFASLSQAYVDGTGVVESLRGQADQLRKIAYEHTREKLKLLPNKLVLIMGLHLMPALFVVVLLPVMFSWGGAIV